MEFTCLWSKDAQQKKRKRWTDGLARFSPTTGLLSVWDQDGIVKISTTRLKPDEAAATLCDDADETRVGGITLQITAPVDLKSKKQHQQTPLVDSTGGVAAHHRKIISTSGTAYPADGRDDSGEVLAGTSAARIICPPPPKSSSSNTITPDGPGGMSKPHTGQASRLERAELGVVGSLSSHSFASSQVVVAESADLGKQSTPTTSEGGGCGFGRGPKRRALKPLVSRQTPQSLGGLTNRIVVRPRSSTDGSKGVSSMTRLGLEGDRVGDTGGARRFHAPRSTRVTVAIQDSDPKASVPLIGSSGLPTDSEKRQKIDGEGGVLRAAAVSSTGNSDTAANEEDLVLEWTTGDPSQSLRAGGSLTRRLHPHQRDGLRVLWQCLAGRGGFDGRGAILADEMGLGKTATAIALCTCVLRHRRAECRKAVVVCPSSLVKNWSNEFRKWCPLGGGAIAVDQAGAAAAQMVADFNIGAPARYPILVISYELYRNHGNVINATEGLGLLIADEGHRLKNSAETKTTRALKACPAAMRLVMTGTPMQNDLDEFFAMADFVNPGLLGSLKDFRSRYTRPIQAAWDREAAEDAKELAAERTRELGELTGKFVLRRTKDVIRGALLPALEIVVFCRLSQQQLSLYERCIAGSSVTASLFGDKRVVGASGVPPQANFREVLPLISTLRRLCNHPDLVVDTSSGGVGIGAKTFDDGDRLEKLPDQVVDKGDDGSGSDSDSGDLAFFLMDSEEEEQGKTKSRVGNTFANGISCGQGLGMKTSWKIPRPAEPKAGIRMGMSVDTPPNAIRGFAKGAAAKYATEVSGKLLVLKALLASIRQDFPGDKVVVASNFTSALDVLGCLAERNGWGFERLDGSTASSARQRLVDRFNRAPAGDLFLFLLSARAGGVGLNLIGANRIVLYDSDWNPATDDQAMARVWRLGQTKEVSMYRLVSTGTLEENIYQRQIFKGALYGLIHDSNDQEPSAIITTSFDGRKAERKHRRLSEGRGHGDSVVSHDMGAKSREGRGFSQDELKDIFVLKAGTVSDTYDKLRRRLPLARRPPGTSERLNPLSSTERDLHDDSNNGEGWSEYNGPSGVADFALRRTLERKAATVGDGVQGESASVAATAGSVVTFVREVKRGGWVKPMKTRQDTLERSDPLGDDVSKGCRGHSKVKTILVGSGGE